MHITSYDDHPHCNACFQCGEWMCSLILTGFSCPCTSLLPNSHSHTHACSLVHAILFLQNSSVDMYCSCPVFIIFPQHTPSHLYTYVELGTCCVVTTLCHCGVVTRYHANSLPPGCPKQRTTLDFFRGLSFFIPTTTTTTTTIIIIILIMITRFQSKDWVCLSFYMYLSN